MTRRRAIIAAAALLLLLVAAVVVSIGLASSHARRARGELSAAVDHLAVHDADGARAALRRAERALGGARRQLRLPWVRAVGRIRSIGNNVRTSTALADAGDAAIAAGRSAADAVERLTTLRLRDGGIDLRTFAAARGSAQDALDAAVEARTAITDAPRSWLFGPVAAARSDAIAKTADMVRIAEAGAATVDGVPRLLGSDRRRRYFIAFANLAELRGTGGLLGYFTVIDVRNGRISRPVRSGRPQETIPFGEEMKPSGPAWFNRAYGNYEPLATWGNVNLSPDFPTTGQIVTDALPPGLGDVDGFIQVDPIALAAILELTGPIRVEPWPRPITADNLARITQHDAYVRLEHEERIAFLGSVVERMFDALLTETLEPDEDGLDALRDVVAGGHFQAYAPAARDQHVLTELGLTRAVDRDDRATDVLGVVTNNSSGNKLDWFLRRHIRYEVQLDAHTDAAAAKLDVKLRNGTPASRRLPEYVAGSFDGSVPYGTNRSTLVSVRPRGTRVVSANLDGETVRIEPREEGTLDGHHVLTRMVPGESSHLTVRSIQPGALDGEGRHRRYRLRVLRQPTSVGDHLLVRVHPPRGWRLVGPTRFEGVVAADHVMEVEIEHMWHAWVAERALLGPGRLALDLWPITLVALVLLGAVIRRRFDPLTKRRDTRLTSADDDGGPR